jgi:hypothetical protein
MVRYLLQQIRGEQCSKAATLRGLPFNGDGSAGEWCQRKKAAQGTLTDTQALGGISNA